MPTCSRRAIDYAEHGYPIDPSLAPRSRAPRTNLAKFPTTAKVFLPGGRAPEAGELFKNPDLATTLQEAGRGRAGGAQAEEDARAGARSRLRSLLQGRHRAGVRPLLQGEPRRDDRRGSGRLSARVAGTGSHDLPRLRRLQQPGHLARRHRTGDAAESGRRIRPREDGREQPGSAAPPHRSDQGRQGRRLSLRGRSEVHADADGRPALEELRRVAAQADRAAQGDGYPAAGEPARFARPARPAPRRRRAGPAGPRSTTTTRPSATRRASRSSISTATPSPARRRLAADSAPASSSAIPGCC